MSGFSSTPGGLGTRPTHLRFYRESFFNSFTFSSSRWALREWSLGAIELWTLEEQVFN